MDLDTTKFDRNTQKTLAASLLKDAGIERASTVGEVIDLIARKWAGVPTTSGLSAYHGYNGNASTRDIEDVTTRITDILVPSSAPVSP